MTTTDCSAEPVVETIVALRNAPYSASSQTGMPAIAEAHQMSAEIEVMPDYPVTVNDATETAYACRVIEATFGEGAWTELPEPLTGSEDFSHVLAEVPGTYALVGTEPYGDANETNHSPRASFGDTALDDVAEFLANAAWLLGRV